MASLGTETVRTTTNMVLCAAGWVICAGVPLAQVGAGKELTALKVAAVALLAAYLFWLMFWSPSVTLSPTTLGVRNLVRRYDIRWSAISDLPVGLTMRAVVGARKVTLIAVPGRSMSGQSYGRGAAIGRSAGGSLDVAFRVRRYWRAVFDARATVAVQSATAPVVVRWLVPELVILSALVLVAILVPTLVS